MIETQKVEMASWPNSRNKGNTTKMAMERGMQIRATNEPTKGMLPGCHQEEMA